MVFLPLTLTISSCLVFSCAIFVVRDQWQRRSGAGLTPAFAPTTATHFFAHASTSPDSAVHGNGGHSDRSTP
jgi:hypothetical protein